MTDAELAAAASDLLAALEDLLRMAVQREFAYDSQDAWRYYDGRDTIANASAAIAKAKGD